MLVLSVSPSAVNLWSQTSDSTRGLLVYQLSKVVFFADPDMSEISLVTTAIDELYFLSALYG